MCVFEQESELFSKLVGLFKYNTNLGTSDRSFKVRDRMRLIKSLVFGNETNDINAFDINSLKNII